MGATLELQYQCKRSLPMVDGGSMMMDYGSMMTDDGSMMMDDGSMMHPKG